MIPKSHLGIWTGPNRLWFEDPATPEGSDGRIEAGTNGLRYTWAFRGEAQSGELALAGPDASLRADWTDTWHAPDGMALHGFLAGGELQLFGTYAAGNGPEWGWQIALDLRDPKHLTLRMFNVPPGAEPVIAVDLRGER